MSQKRILVTGGFGFLGTHLVEELLGAEPTSQIHVVDNLSTNPISPEEFLEEVGPPARFTYSILSVQDYLQRNSEGPFDEIYHLASVVGPAGVLPHAGKMVRSIVEDTYVLVDAALRWKARLVDVSTSEVYGGGQSGFCSEDLPKIVPARATVRLEYAVGKLAAETALINMCRVSDLDAVIIRPFNIAGPRQSGQGGFVLPRFIRQALRGEPLTVFGTGTQVRAFTHVKDIARGLLLTMERGQSGEAYNLGNPMNRVTILELARRVLDLTGSLSPIVFADPKTIYGPLYEEANDKFPDARRAKKELGWEAERGIDVVICDALEDARQRSLGKRTTLALPLRPSNAPLVSICVPTLNRWQQLSATLQTIFAQSLSDFELLICDDGSTDQTPELLSEIEDPRVRILQNTGNWGLPQTLNRMFSLARGKYLAIFHDHDLFHPRLLERCVKLMEKHPNAAFAFSGVAWIDLDERDILTFLSFPDGVVEGKMLRRALMFKLHCPIAMSGAVIQKAALNRLGYFEPRYGISADIDLWIRLTRHYDAVYVREPLIRVRTRTRAEQARHGSWNALRVCRQMRLKGSQQTYAERPLRRAAATAWISLLHGLAEMRESLGLWAWGQRGRLLDWRKELRLKPYHPAGIIFLLLAWSSPFGKILGDARRQLLGRA